MLKSVVVGRVAFASFAHHVKTVTKHLACLRRRMVDFAAIIVGCAVATGAATAGTSGSVRAWYYDSYGNRMDGLPSLPYGMPADLGLCTQVAVGGGHYAAIGRDGTLHMWGNNDWGQSTVPEDFGAAKRVALGELHTVAVATDGYVDAWGYNGQGQLNVPFNLGPCLDVAAGAYHSLAIRTNGSVRGWGNNDWGQRSIPGDLGACIAITAGNYHSVALRTDGVARAWGMDMNGQTGVNGAANIAQISAGPRSTLVTRASDGNVDAYGDMRCAGLPFQQIGYRSVASTYQIQIGVLNDGTLWGRGPDYYGNCYEYGPWDLRMPQGLGPCLSVAGYSVGGDQGYSCFLAIQDNDCNDNGYADADDVATGRTPDLNYNGVPDACDIGKGIEEDCDHDGVIDSYQQGLNTTYVVESAQLGPIGYTSPRSADLAAPPYSLGDVVMRVEGFGDFSSASEYVTVYLNGRYVGKAFYNAWMGKNDCSSVMTDYLYLSRDFYNEAIGNGSSSTSAIFEFRPTIAVNANQCPSGSWIKVHLDYTAAVTEDCNANGLLDVCETRDFPETDANHNGIVDACEDYSLVFECAGDLDGSRAVDTGDMSLLLMNFGYAMPGDPNDLDGNGHIDTADASLMLLSFGPCQ
jgi:hypothetical protein